MAGDAAFVKTEVKRKLSSGASGRSRFGGTLMRHCAFECPSGPVSWTACGVRVRAITGGSSRLSVSGPRCGGAMHL